MSKNRWRFCKFTICLLMWLSLQAGATQQGLTLINAENLSYQGKPLDGSGISIAIIDHGIDTTHPDLGESTECSENHWKNDKVIGGADFGEPNRNNKRGRVKDITDPVPCNIYTRHATRVAGIAAGLPPADPNHVREYRGGVAPGAKLYSIATWIPHNDRPGGRLSSALLGHAAKWIREHRNDDPKNPIKVVIITSSTFLDYYDQPCDNRKGSSVFISELKRLNDEGIAVFGSAGNEGKQFKIRFPACLSGIYAIAAVKDNQHPVVIDNLSNMGDLVQLLAPGETTYSTLSGGGYRKIAGTSAATAYAAGAAAVLQQAAYEINQRYLTPEELIQALKQYGTPVTDNRGNLSGVTKPLINLKATIENALQIKLD